MLRPSKNICLSCAAALLTIICGFMGQAVAASLDQNSALSASRAALGRKIGDYTLIDREGRQVRLADYRGKPLLVSFIYTGCFEVCPTTTRALQKAVEATLKTLGKDSFNIVSIGFNQPADSPRALKDYAAKYNIDQANWEFLSPPAAIVADLTRDFGYNYVATPAGFDHLLQATIVDSEGRVYRQLYGESFGAKNLIEPLRQLLNGTPVADDTGLAELVERVRIMCSVYDPLTGEYRVRYGLVVEIAGGVTFVLCILWLFFSEWLTRRNAKKRLSHIATP